MKIPKVVTLKENEEVCILASNAADAACFKCSSGSLSKIPYTDLSKFITEITNFSFEDLQRYMKFEEYYQLMMSQDLTEDMQKKLKELMQYHNISIYGKTFEDPNVKCMIATFNVLHIMKKIRKEVI